MSYDKMYDLRPDYNAVCNAYYAFISVEYRQSVEEGLDIEQYKDVFMAVQGMPNNEYKAELANTLFKLVANAKTREDYKYKEPSTLEEIKALRKPYELKMNVPENKYELKDRIAGAWYGRICGCLLGKPAEGAKQDELTKFLKDSDNYPMHRYICRDDIKYKSSIRTTCLADEMEFAKWDDDTNYVVLAQVLIRKFGRDFSPQDVIQLWTERQSSPSYFTAEKAAYINFMEGYQPPVTAIYQNPYREWIGAQIRGDYFGYINPGNPELAAEMAFRDASISHVKNGIYGEMFVAAMLACAAVTDNIKDVIYGGLAQIPATSRLYESIMRLIERYDEGVTKEEAFADIHAHWNDKNAHEWCHTISNALVVVASLLYGEGDFGKSICMSVETGFDTDCNGTTVGSIVGMMGGEGCIDEVWKKPTHGYLETTVFGVTMCKISDIIDKTIEHME